MADIASAGRTATSTLTATNGGATETRARHDRSARWAGWTFAAVVAISVPVILYQGRDQWFFLDEWDFLSQRTAGSLHDLMAPHAQHWTTVGILVYRALWSLVGIRHYWPYQLCVVAFHIVAAVLLRVVMRRAGVGPWIATAAATLFVFFGSGRPDIVVGFQIAFTGALAFGLAHMLLADHDGPFDRRDFLGIGFGFLALMCSAVGVTMAVAALISVLVRRGWRTALAHTAPLGAAFVLWSALFGRDSYSGPKGTLSSVLTFGREAFAAVFDGIGKVPGVGALLGLVVVIGVPLALSRRTWAEFRRLDGPTVGLAVAACFFVFTTGYGRAGIAGITSGVGGSESRYVYLVAALLLPAVAMAVSAFVDRWPVLLPFGIALFLVGLPQNATALHASGSEAFTLGDPGLVLTMARLPLAREVPRDLDPAPFPQASFPIGWLVDGVANGRVPPPPETSADTRATAELLLSVYQTTDEPTGVCEPVTPGDLVHVDHGDAIKFAGRSLILRRRIDGRVAAQATYGPVPGRTLKMVGGPLDLVVRPTPADSLVEVCR